MKSVEYLDCPHAGQSIAVLAEPVVLRGVRLGVGRSQERTHSPASAKEPVHAFFVVGLRDAADVDGGVARHVEGDCVLPEGCPDPARHGLLALPAEGLPRSLYLLHHGDRSRHQLFTSLTKCHPILLKPGLPRVWAYSQWKRVALDLRAGLIERVIDGTREDTRAAEGPREGGHQTTLSATANLKLRNSKRACLKGKAKLK